MSQNNTPTVIERFFVLDFDRTLGNTVALYQLFQQIIESVVDNEAMRQLDSARHLVEDRGESFDTIHYVREILDQAGKTDRWQTVVNEFMRRAALDDACLEPGARRLLTYLDAHQYPYGIVTFGGEQWQQLKIKAVGLDAIPAIVTSTQDKGRLLGSWRQPDGWFEIPEVLTGGTTAVTATSLVLVDDNPLNFEDLPDGVTGFYVQNASTRNRDYIMTPRAVVHEVEGLDEVITMLQHDIDKA